MRSLQFSNTRALGLEGKIIFIHNDEETSVSAFESNEVALIRILLPRALGVVSVYAYLYDESMTRTLNCKPASWCGSEAEYDIYDLLVDSEKIGVGLYFFEIELNSHLGRLFLTKDGDRITFSADKSLAAPFQFSISDFHYAECEDKLGGVIYHIFVDRFNRGGPVKLKKDAITDDDWRVIPEYPAYPGAPLLNNHFYGGTLWGIAEKLDYLKSLGVNTIYLSPIFEAASNHKYDTADYMTVDSMFGGEEALVNLIKEAKKLGIGIILDGVFNHTGSDSIYFNRYGNYDSVGAYQSTKSDYYSWYDFKSYPDKYTCWWDIDILPRIHPDRPECGDFFVGEGGVIEKYAELGIDGFRLDVVDELSDNFVACIKAKLDASNDRSVLYGEVWEDASNKIAYDKRKKYYLGEELDGVMNYPLRKGIIDYLTTTDTSSLRYALTDIINNAPKRITDMQMNLLGTHDTERILTVLGGEKASGRSNEYLSRKKMDDLERGMAKRRLRMAYTILATLPGIPTIFYGDEAGMEGYHDPFNRMPYPWGYEDKKLIAFYKKIGKIRRDNSVYKRGAFSLLHLSSDALVFSRSEGEDAYITFVNNTKHIVRVEFGDDVSILTDNSALRKQFDVEAYSAQIFKANRNIEITF